MLADISFEATRFIVCSFPLAAIVAVSVVWHLCRKGK